MELKRVLEKYPKRQDCLIDVLLDVQNAKPTRHLTEDELKDVSDYLGLPESHVFSVVSFYSFFSMKPRGKHIVQVCRDVPCYLNDGFNVHETLERTLDIKTGETTDDGLFTLEYSSCLGCCDQSPVIRVNDTVYGNLTIDKLRAIIAEYRSDDDA